MAERIDYNRVTWRWVLALLALGLLAIPLDADKRDGAFQIYLSIGQSF